MREDPEIVKILREEERKGLLQTGTFTSASKATNNAHDTSNAAQHQLLTQSTSERFDEVKGKEVITEYSSIFQNAPIALLAADEQDRLISWNLYAEDLLGNIANKFQNHSIKELYPTNEWEKILAHRQQELNKQIETKIFTTEGRLLDILTSFYVLHNTGGTIFGTLYLFKEKPIKKETAQWMNTAVESANDAIYLIDSKYRYLAANNAFLLQIGCSRDQITGKKFDMFYEPREIKELDDKFKWVFEHGQKLEDEQYTNSQWFARTFTPVKEKEQTSTLAVLVISRDITELKKTEKVLRQREKKYRTMMECLPQGIMIVDTRGKILEANEQICNVFECKTHDLVGKKLYRLPFFPEESQTHIEKNFSAAPLGFFDIAAELITKQGQTSKGNIHMIPLKNNKKIMGHLVSFSEKSIPKKNEKNKIKNKAIDETINAIVFTDLQGIITYANKSFVKMWGYQQESDIIGKPLTRFWDGSSHDVIKAIHQKRQWKGELTGVKKNRSEFSIQLSATMINDEFASPVCIMGSFIDITEYKAAVNALSESEKKFRVVLENSLDMIYQFHFTKGNYEYVSPSSSKILGYSPEEMMSFGFTKVQELIHPEDKARVKQHFKELVNAQTKQESLIQAIEYRVRHKSLGYRWISDTCSAIFNEHDEPIAVVGNIEDITDRKKVWDALVKSEEKYRILAETSADGVFTTDALGRLTYVNPSFEKMLDRRKSKILGTPFRKYLLDDSIYFFQQIFIDVRKKNEKIENVELEIVTENGTILPIEANIAPLEKQEEFSGVVCTVRDITQRRGIEDELKKNERLKTEFMNIAAHELRSPVTPIKGYLDLIMHDSDTNEKIKNWAKIALRNSERLLKLVNDILDVARLDSDTMRFDMEKLDPVELVNEIAEDAKPAIANKKLEFQVHVPTALPHILGDKNRLSQVLKNLIGNALKFTDTGYIAINAEKQDNHLLISVSDTGIGISNDELKKIFTKFYQAYTGEDRNNEGTGLGLFISKEIVKKHNGTIWAESEVGKGSRFVIELPYVYKMTVDFTT